MRIPTILICNYSAGEVQAWRFLLRAYPGLRLLPVEKSQYGRSLQSLLEEAAPGLPPASADFSERLAVFCNIPGPLLSRLVDLSHRASRGKAYRATLTDTNQSWTLSALMEELRAEERELAARQRR